MKEKLRKYKYHIITAISVIVLIAVFYKYLGDYVYIFTDIKKMKERILGYGPYSWLAFLGMQILQIVIFIIPGEIVQVAAGYIFGPWIGFALSILGAIIGSAITFILSRKLGKPFVQKLVSEKDLWLLKKIEHFKEEHKGKRDSSKSVEDKHKSLRRIVWLLYLIPGIPKDVLGYICGISSLSLKEFLVISNLARAPMLFVSIFFGHNLSLDKISILVVVLVVMTLILFIGVLKGKKLINREEN
ncbi:TVP38/TMEM64 family protein [Clostridium zeae]|uniref:TVP38/TMEM64 family membrane protein n=1 Tax=Clostridium zeae TaxID=2759022 RepID=A0ABQ1ECM1_9CLOT|nr:TVP38/TMEM64 family protein [Clostridium zeae]GFZ32525.1 TVP38/TMEM64 family protein [Clostridium zeae]